MRSPLTQKPYSPFDRDERFHTYWRRFRSVFYECLTFNEKKSVFYITGERDRIGVELHLSFSDSTNNRRQRRRIGVPCPLEKITRKKNKKNTFLRWQLWHLVSLSALIRSVAF